MGKVYGYARCSTSETKQDVERQIAELRAMGATEIYHEYESGMSIQREELNKMLAHVQPGDTIVATEVSRVTRSVKQLCEILDMAKGKKLKLVLGALEFDCSGEVNVITEGMIKMMSVFAEIERNLIVERVKSGLRNARAKGVRLGRPALTIDGVPRGVIERYDVYLAGYISKKDYATLCGISRPTLNKYIALMTDK